MDVLIPLVILAAVVAGAMVLLHRSEGADGRDSTGGGTRGDAGASGGPTWNGHGGSDDDGTGDGGRGGGGGD